MDNTTNQQAEEMREELLFNEAEILKALSDKTEKHDTTMTIEVVFKGASFRFRIRPLSEREWTKCRESNTKYSRNRKLGGMRLPEDTDTVGYHSSLIYHATVKEDRERIWDNKAFWKATGALTGKDMVDILIPLAGKKQAIVDKIEELSGYSEEQEENYEESVKN